MRYEYGISLKDESTINDFMDELKKIEGIRQLQIAVNEIGTIKGGELAWVGDWNEKMLAIHYATGATKDKVHRTYVYTFSGNT